MCALLNTGWAGQFSASPLGASFPYWYEHRASITDTGDSAWTALPGTYAEARARVGGTIENLHLVAKASMPATLLSYAEDVDVLQRVVGYTAEDARETRRVASLWERSGTTWTVKSLHDAVGPGFALSAAYGIATDASGASTIAGYRREGVGGGRRLAEPIVWSYSHGQATVQVLPLEGATYGIAYGASTPTVSGEQWACGGIGGLNGNAYVHAACWQLNDGGRLFVLDDVGPSAGFASSTAERVRRIVVGNEEHVIVVGQAIHVDGRTQGFAINMTTGAFTLDVGLVPNASSMLFDVAGTTFGQSSDMRDAGPTYVGTSSSVDGALPNVVDPSSAGIAGLRGIHRTAIHPVGESVDSCVQEHETTGTTTFQTIVGISPDGSKRLAWGDGHLYALSDRTYSGDTSVYVRDAQVRTTRAQTPAYAAGSTASKVQYFWAEGQGASHTGGLVFANAAGCADVVEDACGTDAAFHLGGAHLEVPFVSAAGGRVLSALRAGLRPSQAYRYVQAAVQTGGTCAMTPVMRTDAIEVVNTMPTQPLEAGREWADCYASVPGFDTDVQISYDHCGVCANSCDRANIGASCQAGSCVYTACDPGYVDLNQNLVDGCECKIEGGTDRPELTGPFLDQNCDGIDGTVASSIFVAGWGTDTAACGTMAAPCKSIPYGVSRASSGMDVLVAAGTYSLTSTLVLKNGVSIHGGYAPTAGGNWARSDTYITRVETSGTMASAVPNGGALVGIQGNAISAPTVLAQLDIVTSDLSGTGSKSNYGIHCVNCNGLTVAYSKVSVGSATAGNAGAVGASGVSLYGSPSAGSGGGNGSCDGGCYWSWGSWKGCHAGAAGGAGGSGNIACGAGNTIHGGRGGQGGHEDSGNGYGSAGAAGGSTGGGGGASGDPGQWGGAGAAGSSGANGTAGSPGLGGAPVGLSGQWVSVSNGAVGALGNFGRGGGGGGGGGAQRGGWVNDGPGNGGGGGGGGGCGGGGGHGGTGGGHAVGILLLTSPSAILRNLELTVGSGGDGGAGGAGGEGVNGASGANGGSACTSEIGGGGRGGNGGKGGTGGGGGGGGGGNVVGIGYAGGAPSLTDNAFTLGAPGVGGVGGFNGMNGEAAPTMVF